MSEPERFDRRALLRRIALGVSLTPALLAKSPTAHAAAAPPWLSETEPAAKAVHYVEDVSRAKEASPGAQCSNCSIYTALSDSAGTCTLFKNKSVKAAGWCSAWSGL